MIGTQICVGQPGDSIKYERKFNHDNLTCKRNELSNYDGNEIEFALRTLF